jgi:hypothetical protein
MVINALARSADISVLSAALGGGQTPATTELACLILTPLFQINFLPLLMHVYFLPALVEVAPAFEHLDPALTAAPEEEMGSVVSRSTARQSAKDFFMK